MVCGVGVSLNGWSLKVQTLLKGGRLTGGGGRGVVEVREYIAALHCNAETRMVDIGKV